MSSTRMSLLSVTVHAVLAKCPACEEHSISVQLPAYSSDTVLSLIDQVLKQIRDRLDGGAGIPAELRKYQSILLKEATYEELVAEARCRMLAGQPSVETMFRIRDQMRQAKAAHKLGNTADAVAQLTLLLHDLRQKACVSGSWHTDNASVTAVFSVMAPVPQRKWSCTTLAALGLKGEAQVQLNGLSYALQSHTPPNPERGRQRASTYSSGGSCSALTSGNLALPSLSAAVSGPSVPSPTNISKSELSSLSSHLSERESSSSQRSFDSPQNPFDSSPRSLDSSPRSPKERGHGWRNRLSGANSEASKALEQSPKVRYVELSRNLQKERFGLMIREMDGRVSVNKVAEDGVAFKSGQISKDDQVFSVNGATAADQMMEHFRKNATVIVELASSLEPLDEANTFATTPPQQQQSGSQMRNTTPLPRQDLQSRGTSPTTQSAHAGRPRSSTFCVDIPPEHLTLLMTDCSLSSKFDEVYGTGASAATLAGLEQSRRELVALQM